MIYTKIEIAPGVELKIDVDPDEMYSTCPICSVESCLDYETIEQLKGDWFATMTCSKPECNTQLKEMVSKGKFD